MQMADILEVIARQQAKSAGMTGAFVGRQNPWLYKMRAANNEISITVDPCPFSMQTALHRPAGKLYTYLTGTSTPKASYSVTAAAH